MSVLSRWSARALWLIVASGPMIQAADWPQFMREAAHTGDAGEEVLRFPLGLAAQVKLDDAIMTAPAVVGGRAYVVDQMGTAYCIDPRVGLIVWKASPDGSGAMGFNTSSPCVVAGRVHFGTTAGTFHILDARDGKLIKTLKIGSPIISAPTFANDSIYFQALDAVLRCLDLDGNERWQWNHYARYQEPPEITKKHEKARGHPGGYDRPNYGGGDVAAAGKRIVTSFGWDSVCLEDAGTEARLVWCNRAATGRDGSAPMSSSISGDWVYNTGMGADGEQALTRLSLRDGQLAPRTGGKNAYPWITPAVRGAAATLRDSSDGKNGFALYDFEVRKTLASWRNDEDAAPFAGSHALAKDHLVATTLRGEVIVVVLAAKPNAPPFRFQTPHAKGIGSSPAISSGCVYFGCDDGYFYVLGPDGKFPLIKADRLAVHEPRSKVQPATGKTYSWPSTGGSAGNACFVDDRDLKPPLRVRWATRGFGHFKAPCIATEEDVISVTLSGFITCQEQATGRLPRWRRQMPGPEWGSSAGLLAHDGRLFVPRPPHDTGDGTFHCLDLATGRTLWTTDIGGRYIWERSSPVAAAGQVAFGFARKGSPAATIVQAWDAATGKPTWQVELNVAGKRSGSIAGCTDGKNMYFTAGAEAWQWKQEGNKKRGEAVAIEATTGKVLWRFHELFGISDPVLAGDRLLLNEHGKLNCVSPLDGKVFWSRTFSGYTHCSVGPDFLVLRGYGGHGAKVRLDDGKDYPNCNELGGPTHACGAVALTPNFAFAITVGGLNVRDVKTGRLLWQSPGFAPRGCVNAILANGRVFWPSAASGMIFCWEPSDS